MLISTKFFFLDNYFTFKLSSHHQLGKTLWYAVRNAVLKVTLIVFFAYISRNKVKITKNAVNKYYNTINFYRYYKYFPNFQKFSMALNLMQLTFAIVVFRILSSI